MKLLRYLIEYSTNNGFDLIYTNDYKEELKIN